MRAGPRRAQAVPRHRQGLWIAFFGPDGVGKSTVIERLPNNLAGAFSGFAHGHFRPRFGLRQAQAKPVTAPHAQTARGSLISYGKLMYWLLDCWLGYGFKVRPALRRSRLVIFDRYVPDLLVDPVRYRLPVSAMKFASWLVTLAPQPDICVLLDAPAEIVQPRKREISLAETQRQRLAYLKFFEGSRKALVVDAGGPVEEVAREVAAMISSCKFRVSSFKPAASPNPVHGAGGVTHQS